MSNVMPSVSRGTNIVCLSGLSFSPGISLLLPIRFRLKCGPLKSIPGFGPSFVLFGFACNDTMKGDVSNAHIHGAHERTECDGRQGLPFVTPLIGVKSLCLMLRSHNVNNLRSLFMLCPETESSTVRAGPLNPSTLSVSKLHFRNRKIEAVCLGHF